MTGDNCAIVDCGANRRTKGIGIFKLPSLKLHPIWRKDWLNEITKNQVIDAKFKEKIKNDTVFTCERHFEDDDLEICK